MWSNFKGYWRRCTKRPPPFLTGARGIVSRDNWFPSCVRHSRIFGSGSRVQADQRGGMISFSAPEVEIRSYVGISARDQPGGRSFDPRTCFDPRKFWISQIFFFEIFLKNQKKSILIFAGAIFSSFSSKITPWRGSFMNVQPI